MNKIEFLVADCEAIHAAYSRYQDSKPLGTVVGPVVARVGNIAICAVPRYGYKTTFGRRKFIRLRGFKLTAVFPQRGDEVARNWDICECTEKERWPLAHFERAILRRLEARKEAMKRIGDFSCAEETAEVN